ncbi:MAG: hypothetical protein ACK55Z_00615, partial [bacterium]
MSAHVKSRHHKARGLELLRGITMNHPRRAVNVQAGGQLGPDDVAERLHDVAKRVRALRQAVWLDAHRLADFVLVSGVK